MAYTIQEISRETDSPGNTWIELQVSETKIIRLKFFRHNPSSEEVKRAVLNFLDENIQLYDE